MKDKSNYDHWIKWIINKIVRNDYCYGYVYKLINILLAKSLIIGLDNAIW